MPLTTIDLYDDLPKDMYCLVVLDDQGFWSFCQALKPQAKQELLDDLTLKATLKHQQGITVKLLEGDPSTLSYDPQLVQVKERLAPRLTGPNADLVCWWLAWKGPESDKTGAKHKQALLIGDHNADMSADKCRAIVDFLQLPPHCCGIFANKEK